MPSRRKPDSSAIQKALRQSAWKKALVLAAPGLAPLLPRDLTVFYGFVGEEDMLADNPYRPALSRAALTRALNRLGVLEKNSVERWALESYLLLCADRYEEAERAAAIAQEKAAWPSLFVLRATALWLIGNEKRSWGTLPEARRLIEHAVRGGLRDREALLLRAQIRLECRDIRLGALDLKTILRRWPQDDRTRLGLIDALSDLKRFEEANREMRLILKRHRRDWWAWAQWARLLGLAGELSPALKNFNRALSLQKKHGPLYAWRAEILRLMGRFEEAGRDLDTAIRMDPRYSLSWEWRGRLRLLKNRPLQALADLDRACRLDPTHILAFAWRAEARLKTGRLKEAFQDIMRISPLNIRNTWNAPAFKGKMPDRQERELAFRKNISELPERYPGSSLAKILKTQLLSNESTR